MTAEPITSHTSWGAAPRATCYVVAPDRDNYGHRVTHVLLCEHEDDNGTLVTYETPIGDAGYQNDFWMWACPAGRWHEEQE